MVMKMDNMHNQILQKSPDGNIERSESQRDRIVRGVV